MPNRELSSEDVRKFLINPMYCLSTPPVIGERQWIEANARLIRELGPETYLRQLLDTIKNPPDRSRQ
jgi:hypothetical protein